MSLFKCKQMHDIDNVNYFEACVSTTLFGFDLKRSCGVNASLSTHCQQKGNVSSTKNIEINLKDSAFHSSCCQ